MAEDPPKTPDHPMNSVLSTWEKINRALGMSEENIALGHKSAEAYSRGDFIEGAKLAQESNWRGNADMYKAFFTHVADVLENILPSAPQGIAGKKPHIDDGNRTRTRARPTRDRETF